MTTNPSQGARDAQAGITLIEMLVSLVIFAFVGLASFTMLDTLLTVQDRTEGRLEALANIDRALFVFSNDFKQGDAAALELDADGVKIRVGDTRHHMYRFFEGDLVRSIQQNGPATPALEQVLVPDLRSVRFEILDLANAWQASWPMAQSRMSPRAVQMTLETQQAEIITRIVPLTATVTP